MAGNDNEDLFTETFDECDDGEQELEESSPQSDGEQSCSICNDKLHSPRLLSCLHVFCLGCLEKKKRMVENGRETIVCPKCQQETYLGRKGVHGLACDYISTNIQDMLAINSKAMVCTSCKTKEKAVARCSDCAHFLCPNCDTAHQYMRCFENHKVVSFEVLLKAKEAVPIHKPVFCETHVTEPMKFFCNTCSVTICNECVVVDHCAPEHHYERLSDAYERHKEHLHSLMGESKTKMAYCEDATNSLNNALAELQAQHDNAKGLINETFQSYKAMLEKRKDDILDELKELHSERELKIMEMFHVVEKSVERIEDASKFTQRLLEHGSPAEVLCLRQLVSTQLLNLINNTPKPDVNTTLEFVTDMDKFTSAIQTTFGHFRKQESPVGTATTTPQQESPPPPALSLVTSSVACPPSSVTSSPVSMPSSYEGELALAPLLPFTSIQEYNLSALASLAEGPSQVSTASSPTSSFTLNDLLCGDITSSTNAIKNLEALVKLGNVSLNEPGKLYPYQRHDPHYHGYHFTPHWN
uniref:RING finger protein 207 n=1 Tax=Graphocephala atropunctata TaxID=36148 RepID=A0A1B6L209_9HEMI